MTTPNLNSEADSPLNAELAAACDNPQELDCGFEKQREATGFANFGYDPVRAAEMRAEEQLRIDNLEPAYFGDS